jgi:four helix bundle protein
MRDFRKYKVWEQSHQLALQIYSLTKGFSKEEIYGLTSQIRRASISVPTNIVEGAAKASEKDFARFLGISYASAAEVEYLLLLCKDLDIIQEEIFAKITDDVISIKKQLYNLIKTLNT